MSEILSKFLPKPAIGRRLVISDIHGCSRTFKKLIKKVKLTKEDQLFLLGDLINKGPKSDKVLDTIIKLKKKGYLIFVIRGNHEQIVIQSAKKTTGQRKRILRSVDSLRLLEDKQIKPAYYQLLINSFHYLELDQFYLVHAGFNIRKNTFSDAKKMLYTKDFTYDKTLFKGKQVVIGHSPQDKTRIKESIKNKKPIICIDNGCINTHNTEQGRLFCLNLDTLKTHSSSNQEKLG